LLVDLLTERDRVITTRRNEALVDVKAAFPERMARERFSTAADCPSCAPVDVNQCGEARGMQV
jgi:hypothetical protein